jgi:6-hydroxytryprostatin B O-methyltransferase
MSSFTPSLLDLASQIQHGTQAVHIYLQQHSLPLPSFSADAFPFFPGTGPAGIDPFPTPDQSVLDARRDVRQACETLLQLMHAPTDHFFWRLACAHHTSACVQYIYHFKIAEAVPVDSDVSYVEIAQKTGLDENQCRRIIRMVMTNNYFHEPRPGYVAYTVGSKLLLNKNMNDSIGYLIEEGFPAASRISETVEKFGPSGERNQTPWNVAHEVDLPIFEFFETNPARMTRFLGNMENVGTTEGYSIKHLISGYDWKGLGTGTVVDVGGSVGHCCFAIAEVAPEMEFVVQDLEKVVEGVKERVKGQKHFERIEFQAHSFFEPQPVRGAHVYLLRFICHDYSDKYAAKILGNIIPAMGPKSRIVVMDGVVPPPGILSHLEERVKR